MAANTAAITIKDDDLAPLKGKVVLLTGGSSGIGLATTQLLLSLGASVVLGDLLPPKEGLDHPSLVFQKCDVTNWKDQLALFKKTKEIHGRIDHVFANAGISIRANYLATDLDENGDLKEPSFQSLDVNLRGAMNTATLGIYYMRPEQQNGGGSIVVTSSIAAFQRFRGVDYAAGKHGNLGFVRGMRQLLIHEKLPIRINAIAPSWTETGILPAVIMEQIGVKLQPPEVPARSALLLMADESRNGQLLHSTEGKIQEVEESVLVPTAEEIIGKDKPTEDTTLMRMLEAMGGEYKDKV
ncbi:hypothetical protein AJ79_04813 [Helicocarpus griseus UAMH5409]|uniref:Uncharacterized protein n=1 Tax=Helicocarpus griseus UAMH5409 TaxID=1447875 RepID=A0A2B7XRH9_9EURO|nr:hypothetical protein AJ79_04813 [Helicocarpus griseus UAMH5409]